MRQALFLWPPGHPWRERQLPRWTATVVYSFEAALWYLRHRVFAILVLHGRPHETLDREVETVKRVSPATNVLVFDCCYPGDERDCCRPDGTEQRPTDVAPTLPLSTDVA